MKTLETLFSGSKYGKSLDFADADNNIKITYTTAGSKKQLGGRNNLYDFITDPITNRSYNLFSNKGKSILKKYREA
jgi:hypothetical protein|tara:strand:+ start:119 stop:346 length:228 start_codon:yes stop_codon:yes gene_type:complete